MSDHSERYRCTICNKTYANNSSLWNHNNKFHSDKIVNVNNKVNNVNNNVNNTVNTMSIMSNTNKKYFCETCNKNFTTRQAKSLHKNKFCKKDLIVDDNKLIINPNQKTINSNNINNTNNINNQQINNGIINNNNTTHNIIINQIGKESLDGVSMKDILSIVKEGNNMPIICIKKVNFNKKYPENHSFCTTTLEGKHFTRINHKTQKPEKINKIDFINEVLESSLRFIQNISLMVEFDESFRDSIPDEHKIKIKDILDNQDKFHDPKNKKAFFNCINDMSYNFKDIILETWKLIQPKENEEFLMDEKYIYLSSDED